MGKGAHTQAVPGAPVLAWLSSFVLICSLGSEAVCPGSSSSTFWTAAPGTGELSTRASEPGLTSEAGRPRGSLRDRRDPWGVSLVALTLVPKTRFLILPAGGDDTAPQPGQVCEPTAAPDAKGLAPPLHLHHGNPGPSSGCGGLWPCVDTAHAEHWPPRAGAEAGRDTPGVGVGAVGATRSAGGRARQAGSRGLSAGTRRPWRGRGSRR